MKTYVKPELFYENFELSQHIATCAWDLFESTNPNNCAIKLDQGDAPGQPDIILFNASIDACFYKDLDGEIYCYTNHSIDGNVYNS